MKSSFNKDQHTIGIEWELFLVDQESYRLANIIHPLLQDIGTDSGISLEAFQSCVEVKTSPVKNTVAAQRELTKKLSVLTQHCRKYGVRLCSLGAHPFDEGPGETTRDKRYLDFEAEYPYITRYHLTCSTQLHVSMGSEEEAILVINRMRKYLPVFTALSSSCPYWHGERTGHVSFRQHLTRAAQNSGLPPQFSSWNEFERYFNSSIEAGFISGIKDIHWDIRPRPDLGTIEFRVMDAMPSLSENMALCALAHCLIEELKREPLSVGLLADVPDWAEKENMFQAAHLGVEARIITSPQESKNLGELALRLCDVVEETANQLGEYEHVAKARDMIVNGPPYERMMKQLKSSHSFKQVIENASNELLL